MERTRKSRIRKNEDGIWILPEVIILTILGLLDMKTVVQTSALSTKWRSMWKSVSVLEFDSRDFIDPETEEVLPFIEFVDTILLHRDTSDMNVFSLCWHNKSDDIIDYFTPWILNALGRNVQVLRLEIKNNIMLNLKLPHHILISQSLTKLTFDFDCDIDPNFFLPNSICLPSLKSLILRSFMSDGVDWVNKLLSSCPVLSSLEITDMWVREDPGVNVECHELKHLEITNTTTSTSFMTYLFKLSTPSLTSFICQDYMVQKYYVENFSSLITASIDMMKEGESASDEFENENYPERMVNFLAGLQNVKQLTLSPADFLQVVSEFPNLMELQFPQFHNLRYLKLEMYFTRCCLQTLTWLLKSCPYVEDIFLTSEESNEEEEEGELVPLAPCTLSHLKVMEIAGFEGRDTEIQFLELALNSAIVLEKIDLHFGDGYTTDIDDRLKLMKQLRALQRVSSSLKMEFHWNL